MKLIIDVPEDVYNYIMRLNLCNMAEEYIKNGAPLSEGDLISRADAIDACDQSINLFEAVDRIKDLPRK